MVSFTKDIVIAWQKNCFVPYLFINSLWPNGSLEYCVCFFPFCFHFLLFACLFVGFVVELYEFIKTLNCDVNWTSSYHIAFAEPTHTHSILSIAFSIILYFLFFSFPYSCSSSIKWCFYSPIRFWSVLRFFLSPFSSLGLRCVGTGRPRVKVCVCESDFGKNEKSKWTNNNANSYVHQLWNDERE